MGGPSLQHAVVGVGLFEELQLHGGVRIVDSLHAIHDFVDQFGPVDRVDPQVVSGVVREVVFEF